MLEPRLLLAFANWSSIQPAIGLVPGSAGQLASASVVNFGAPVYSGTLNVVNTLNRIRANNGPDRTDDGIVYTNPQASGLPVDGTYFEFTVEVSNGTDRNFSSLGAPGPMRILLATGGDCFFTGDHYSTFQPVSIYGGANSSSPTIGSFSASPASVTVGSPTKLTASNVTETNGTISSVIFYLESNGTSGLQMGADTLIGTGTLSGTSWSIAAPDLGLSAGTYTYYAVAIDSTSVSSSPASTSLSITSAAASGVLATWEVTGQSGYGTQGLAAISTATGITNSLGLTRGSAITTTGTAAGDAWGGANWASTSVAGITGNEFVTFGLTVSSITSLASLDLNYRHSNAGPTGGYWQYQLNGGSWGLVGDFPNQFPSNSSNGAAITEMDLSGIPALQSMPAGTIVNLRVTPYGATGSGGTWYVYNRSGSDLVTSGSTSTSLPLSLTGPANYLKLDADGQHLDIWNNSIGPGSAAPRKMLLSQISSMSCAGTAVDDALTVDFSVGDPLVSSGLNYTGGGGTNSLKVVGTSGSDAIAVTSSQITIGAAAINYNGASDVVLDPGGGADSLNITGAVASLPVAPTGAGIVTRKFSNITIGTNGAFGVPTAANHGDRTLIVAASYSDLGTLDLGGNDLVVNNGNLSLINSQIQNFDMTSSATAADSTHLTALAAIQNSVEGTPSGTVLQGSFDGAPAVATDILIKYTYLGDINLDGKIDGSDYARIDAGFLAQSTGWFNGDFNGDNIINGSDYTLIDNAFNRQGAALTVQIAARPASIAVAIDDPRKHKALSFAASRSLGLIEGVDA